MVHPLAEDGDQASTLQHLSELWHITNDPEMNFESKLDQIFSRETDLLRLPYGFISETDLTTNTQTIKHAYGSHDMLQAGQSCPLTESYCRYTIQESDGVFHISDAVEEGFDDDPAYERFELGSYVGGVIEFGGTTHGTLCFASSEPRGESITEAERTLTAMLGIWASNRLHDQQLQQRLKRQTDQVEELATVISHDLRNPLAIAQGQAHLLEESIQESLSQIESAHDRMSTLINDILTLTRLDDEIVDPTSIDFDDLVHECWEMVETHDATLRNRLDDVIISANTQRLKQLLENIFRNAIDHGGTSVTVTIGLMDGGFFIEDDGSGIAPSEREYVFNPGYSGNHTGTGFGLSIVKQIAEAHTWEVSVSESKTGGARFEFTGVSFDK